MKNRKKLLESCRLCPRKCGVNRLQGEKGYCGMDSRVYVARAALHMWEEPCISGEKGSGAVFFSGCCLRCCFCQNREIAEGKTGKEISVQRLSDIFLELQQKGAANLNLVTAGHYLPQVLEALDLAREKGLRLPVVYNCGGYEDVQALKLLEGYVDVYLPDFKYLDRSFAQALSKAPDYPETAIQAIREMIRQTGPCVFDEEGYIRRGTIVRHLILPGHTRNSKAVLQYLKETYGDTIYVSIMNQYTPVWKQEHFLELNRKVTKREYEKVLEEALSLKLEHAYIQEGDTADESFIPPFDLEGV